MTRTILQAMMARLTQLRQRQRGRQATPSLLRELHARYREEDAEVLRLTHERLDRLAEELAVLRRDAKEPS